MSRMKWTIITDKSVPGIEKDRYIVSQTGQIWDMKEQRFPSVFLDNQGYLRTYVKGKDGNFIMIFIHRTVKLEHHGPDNDPEKNIIDHIDADKQDNYLNNLDWVTQTENALRAIRKGLYTMDFVLDENDVPIICQMLKDGNSYSEISSYFYSKYKRDISDIIGKIYRGERWKHISKKYMPFPKLNKSLLIPDNSFYTIEMINEICGYYESGLRTTEIAHIIKNKYNLAKDIKSLANSIGEIKTKGKFKEISKNYNF